MCFGPLLPDLDGNAQLGASLGPVKLLCECV